MKKRIVAVLFAAVLVLGLLGGCKEKVSSITAEEAQQIALDDAGLSIRGISNIHAHEQTYQDIPCYSVHIKLSGKEYEYIIARETGEILHADPIERPE